MAVATGWRVCELPLEQVQVGGLNVRQMDVAEDPEFWELVASIRQYGQLSPVWVGREGEGYRLIAGERRYRALQQLKHPAIRAMIVDAPPEEWSVLMLIENVQRKQLEPWEEAAGYRMLLDHGWSLSAVAQQTGKAVSHISMVLKIVQEPRICAALQDRAISTLSLARELSALMDFQGREKQSGSIEAALQFIRQTRPTVATMRQWVQTRLNGESAAITPKRARSAARLTPVRSEEQRLRHIMEHVIPQLSGREAAALADLYADFAQLLRQGHRPDRETTEAGGENGQNSGDMSLSETGQETEPMRES